MREAALETLIEDVRSNPERERVVDHLIAPAIRLRTFSAPNKRFALGQIADSAKGLSDEELADTVKRLTDTRRQSVKQANFDDAIRATKEVTRAEEARKKREFEEKRKVEQDPNGAVRKALADQLVQGELGRRAAAEGWLAEAVCEAMAKRDSELGQLDSWGQSALHKRWVPSFKAARDKQEARLRALLGLDPREDEGTTINVQAKVQSPRPGYPE